MTSTSIANLEVNDRAHSFDDLYRAEFPAMVALASTLVIDHGS